MDGQTELGSMLWEKTARQPKAWCLVLGTSTAGQFQGWALEETRSPLQHCAGVLDR